MIIVRLTLALSLNEHHSSSEYIVGLVLRLSHRCNGCGCPYTAVVMTRFCNVFVRSALLFCCYCVTVVGYVSAATLTVRVLVSVLPLHLFIGSGEVNCLKIDQDSIFFTRV